MSRQGIILTLYIGVRFFYYIYYAVHILVGFNDGRVIPFQFIPQGNHFIDEATGVFVPD